MFTLKTKDRLETLYERLYLTIVGDAPITTFPRVKEHQRVMVGVVETAQRVDLEWVVVEPGLLKMPGEGPFQDIDTSANGLVSFTLDRTTSRYLHRDGATATGAHWFDYDFLAFGTQRVQFAPEGGLFTVVDSLRVSSYHL